MRDLDICREATAGGLGWACGACGNPHDPEAIEERLIGVIQQRALEFIAQDVECKAHTHHAHTTPAPRPHHAHHTPTCLPPTTTDPRARLSPRANPVSNLISTPHLTPSSHILIAQPHLKHSSETLI